MLVLIILQNIDEQSVALLIHTVNSASRVLEQLRKDGIRVAQSCLVELQSLFVLFSLEHQVGQASEQFLLEQEIAVFLISSQVQVEAGDQSDQ